MDLEEEVLDEKSKLAVLHFRSGSYTKAAELFSELVRSMDGYSETYLASARTRYNLSERPIVGSLIHPKLLQVLDQRAATWEKLKDPQRAFRDAKKMISLDPTSCKAYLRLGKLYLKEGKELEAYKTYQRGVFTIERAIEKLGLEVLPKLIAQLKEQYRKLNRELKAKKESSVNVAQQIEQKRTQQRRLDEVIPAKRPKKDTTPQRNPLDPFQILPFEIVEHIFRQVPGKDLFKCHLVCKGWYTGLTHMPKLYRDSFVLRHRVNAREYFSGLQLMHRIEKNLALPSLRLIRLGATRDVDNLGYILESIITEKTLRIKRLEIVNLDMNIDLLFQKLQKKDFERRGLESIESLKLGINTSIYESKPLLELFPNLQRLEILCLDCKLRGSSYKTLLQSKEYNHLMYTAGQRIESNICSLTLVNNPGLIEANQPGVQVGSLTFLASPPLLDVRYPELEEYTLVGYAITPARYGLLFSHLLSASELLRALYFEQVEGLTLHDFLQFICVAKPRCKLKTLTVRNATADEALIETFNVLDFGCLSELKCLDIYDSSISNKSLLKLLELANQEGALEHINLGHPEKIALTNDRRSMGGDKLDFSVLLQAVPNLQSLVLCEQDLDNYSMRQFATDLSRVRGASWSLQYLDLSFCQGIDGVGLMSLLGGNIPRVKTLVLDGLDINIQTLNYCVKKGLVGEIKCDPQKQKWIQYGVNSRIIPNLSKR
ncbi:hypothetical protein PUMCH_002733 [Australozyma saopauloensis]|uniref:F-box domain-containing protein n=1 Tax=Australozyma saopauloensis TaxID=291208 RepID=A0AAX4HA44_9ASCO|nr:hypothetical protein PUMCH_002733 [[Candida] saopauloensis]